MQIIYAVEEIPAVAFDILESNWVFRTMTEKDRKEERKEGRTEGGREGSREERARDCKRLSEEEMSSEQFKSDYHGWVP